MIDYHDIEARETSGARSRLRCFCGHVTAWYSDTAEKSATRLAAEEIQGHLTAKADEFFGR